LNDGNPLGAPRRKQNVNLHLLSGNQRAVAAAAQGLISPSPSGSAVSFQREFYFLRTALENFDRIHFEPGVFAVFDSMVSFRKAV
jgi:hypothetical protein